MPPIEWDAGLETGDAALDHQHRGIHTLFNHLESSADDAAEVMRVLDFLTEHVLVHFATEEDLMARTGYPADLTEAHIAEHRALTENVRDEVLAFRLGQLTSTEPLIEFLRDWLTHHVHESDLRFVEHIHSSGVRGTLPDEWVAAEQRANV